MELIPLADATLEIMAARSAERAGRTTDPVESAARDRVIGLVIDALRTGTHGHQALTALDADPSDPVRRAEVHLAIRTALAEKPEFHYELARAVRLAQTVERLNAEAETEQGRDAEGWHTAPVARRWLTTVLLILGVAGFSAAVATLTTVVVLR